MAKDFRVEGVEALRGAGRALALAGDGKELKKALVKNLREVGKPAADDMRSHLREVMPARGGLAAAFTRRRFSVRNRITGRGAGVRIVALGSHAYKAVEDRGRLRHPVYANAALPKTEWTWVTQQVPGAIGALSKAFEDHEAEFAEGIQDALQEVIRGIERSIEEAS